MRFIFFLALTLSAQTPPKGIHPQVKEIVDGVSEERVSAIMKRLGEFPSRNTNFEQGNKASREWIADQFKSFSPRLDVQFDSHHVTKQGRIVRDLDVVNVVATLPGTTQKDQEIIICAHYDSLNIIRKKDAVPGAGDNTDWVATAEAIPSPGVSDNASGVALVLELARLPRRLSSSPSLAKNRGCLGAAASPKRQKKPNATSPASLTPTSSATTTPATAAASPTSSTSTPATPWIRPPAPSPVMSARWPIATTPP
jgi:hypothetical protein